MTDKFNSLTSLAILKVDLDKGARDYLDYFKSFVIYILNKSNVEVISDVEVCKLLEKEFGLKIPIKATQLILKRLSKKGILIKEYGIYRINSKLQSIDFDEKRNNVRDKINILYERLKTFVENEFNESWIPDKVSIALSNFLSKFGIEYLKAFIFKTALPEVPSTGFKEHYIISRFIKDLHENNDPIFENVSVLVKGQMYANALLCPDLDSINKNFKNVTFYLDTSIILCLLELHSNPEIDAANEMINLVKKLKGNFAVFSHTVEEVHHILKLAEENIDNPKYSNKVINYLKTSNKELSDIIVLRENINEIIKEKGIQLINTPPYKNEFQISEIDLEIEMKKDLTYVSNYTLNYDINSIRSIYVLRKDSMPLRLEDSVAVFVTQNSIFAKAVYHFGKNHNSSKEVSSVITDFSLANVAWLKAPLGSPDLPKIELLATCYAALNPSQELFNKYLDEIDKQVQRNELTADEHAILRSSSLVSKELMDLTLGNESALNKQTTTEVLQRIKNQLVKEKDNELRYEYEKRKTVENEVINLKEKQLDIQKKIYWICDTTSNYVSNLIKWISIVLLLVSGLISPYISTPFISNSFLLTSLLFILIYFLIAFSIINLWCGLNVNQLTGLIKDKLNNYFYEKSLKYLLKIK